MKKAINILASLLVVLVAFTSCLKGGDESTVVYYNDTAITSVVLGTMKRTAHTVSSKGYDSTYTVSYAGSKYPMYIDQAKNLIYNADSLPVGTAQKMLVSVSALNSSYTYVKSLTSDTLYSCNDSIDFSESRTIRVYSSDGTCFRDYNMEVRIHQEEENLFVWSRRKDADMLAPLTNMRGMSVGDNLFVFGVREGATAKAVYTSPISDGYNWTLASETLAADADIINDGSCLYALSNGQILKSNDGASWTSVASAPTLKHLVGATKTAFYATDANGFMISDNGCVSWRPDVVDDDAKYLPTEDLNVVCMPISSNADLEKIIVLGRRDAATYVDDLAAVIWSKVDGEKMAAEQQPWIHQGYGRDNFQIAPALAHLTVIPYNGSLILVGGDGVGACTQKAFEKVLYSTDQGVAWRTSSSLKLPSSLDGDGNSFAMMADKNNYLWIITGGKGQVWKGTYTQMQWKE